MIQLSSLTKAYGDRTLFENVTWQISPGERVGLCGPNGAGKTTLLRILAGLEEADAGAVHKPAALEVGYLPQDGLVHEGRTLFEEASTALAHLLAIRQEIAELEDRLGDTGVTDEEHDRMLVRYSDLQDAFRARDGYTLDLRVATVLTGLGFSREDFDRPTETFSGGWQMRIALAKLLLGRPGLLLLDEPTNHLDLDARNWLETFLTDYPHAVILVSHDRFFLDAVVTRITELELRTLTDYHSTYSAYLVERDERLARLRDAKRQQDEEIARVKAFIDRFRYQATKAAQVQSRIKMLEKVVPLEVPPERKRVHFHFPTCPKSGRTVLELKHASKRYGDKTVFRDVNLHIERGDRLALIGPNGAGKSTLMRLLSGVEASETGTRTEGHHVVTQYFAQDEATRLDPALTVHETLAAGAPVNMVPAIRNILGGFLFSGDDVYKRVRVLSGGERTRLAVARMLLRPANLLLLDEPTNHLDIDSKDILLDALIAYGGTLIFVSHDRYFVEKLATKVVEIGHGHAVVYPGRYDEFLWSKAKGGSAAVAQTPAPKAQPAPARAGRGPAEPQGQEQKAEAGPARVRAAAEREEKRRLEAEQRRRKRAVDALQGRIADLEARVAERERAIKDIEAAMASPGFYENRDESQPLIDRHQALMWEVGDLTHQWEELQHQMAELEAGHKA
jgi:ATP-binding cassette subfamily F protein 3